MGDTGKVYAVDESSDMIRHINRRIRELKVTNVVSILADPDDPLLPEGQSNQVSLAHETNAETRREIIMIDFHKKELPVGAPQWK